LARYDAGELSKILADRRIPHSAPEAARLWNKPAPMPRDLSNARRQSRGGLSMAEDS